MRHISFLFAFSVLVSIASGQKRDSVAKINLDSLYEIMDRSKQDSVKWLIAREVIIKYHVEDASIAVLLSKRLVEVSTEAGKIFYIARSLQLLGVSYSMSGVYDSCQYFNDKAITHFEESKNYGYLSAAYLNKGITENLQGRYNAAFASFTKGLEIAEKHNLPKARLYASIGSTYSDIKDYTKAIYYDSLAIEEAKAANESDGLKDLLLGNYASRLINIGKYTRARQIVMDLIMRGAVGGQKYYLANYYESLAEIDLLTRHYDAARISNLKALELFTEANSVGELSGSYALLSRIEFLDHRFASAQRYAERGKQLADSLNILSVQVELTQRLALIHLVNKQYDRFLSYDSLYKLLNDSLNINEQKMAVAELNVQYESEKKEKENLVLRASQITLDTRILRQRYAIVIIALSLIATLILIFIIRQRNEIARRNNLLLQRKNAAIEMQAKEILLQKEEIESTNESLKQTIQEVKTMQAQLVHSEKMSSLGQMTAGIAHEINNPLNFIAGSAQALKFSHDEFIREARQSTVLDQLWIEEMQIESDNLFDALDNGVYRVSKIVSSLKAFASPQQGRMVEASIREIIEMSLTLLNTQIRENNVDVVRNYDAVNSHVRLNTTQITQVFTNIMVNAIDAMRAIEKPQLVIATTETTEMVQTLIKDNGCGMPFEIQPRVLEPFFTTKQVGKGTGLGLSVSLGFIESHGGNLKFSSEPGKGTIFIVELPKSRDQSVFNDPH